MELKRQERERQKQIAIERIKAQQLKDREKAIQTSHCGQADKLTQRIISTGTNTSNIGANSTNTGTAGGTNTNNTGTNGTNTGATGDRQLVIYNTGATGDSGGNTKNGNTNASNIDSKENREN